MGETTILSVGLRGGQSTPKLIVTRPFTAVYSLYSVLIVTFFLVMSPYLAWQAVRHRKYIGSLGQRLGYLPISFNRDGVNPDRLLPVQVERNGKIPEALAQAADVLPVAHRLPGQVGRHHEEERDDQDTVKGVHAVKG